MAIVQGRQLDVDANPRAVIGGNKPPLDEQVVIDLNEALSEKGITKRIAELIASFERAPTVIENADTAGKVADLIKQMSAAAKAVTAERETINRPILNAQRSLKGRADSILDPLQIAEQQCRDCIRAFDAVEREKERQRQMAAEAERRRLQEIADNEARLERERLQKIEDERAAAEAREAKPVEVEAVQIELPVEKAEPETVRGDYGAKVVRTTNWKHEIESVRKLPDSILTHEKVLEAINKVIAAQVRGGTREMKGVRIFAETATTIR